MIHSVGSYGAAGSLKQGLDYCYGELDHNKEIREEVTHLRGNPEQLFEIEKTLTTKNTYVHTSLSFTEKEADMLDADPEKLDAIMDDYVEQMAAGLPSSDRLPYIAVKHRDADKFHVEFLFLRMDLQTGKSYQPFVSPRGDTYRFNDWNVTMQDKHGLENPNSIEHQKTSTWSKNLPKQVKAIRDEIDGKISAMVEGNQLNNRQQIIDFINKTKGMEVARVIPSAISIKVDGQKTNIKLKGALYASTFTSTQSVRRAMEQRAEVNVEQSKQRLSESMQKFAKASHHKYEKSPLDVGVNPIADKPNNICIGTDMDVVSIQRYDKSVQNRSGRVGVGQSSELTGRQVRQDVGATKREEIKKPVHKIFNGVEYNQDKQAWLWRGSYGYAQVTPTGNGYSIANGNKMEWTMAAELLKEKGATHVSLTCSSEQSMIKAIKAHTDVGLTITDISTPPSGTKLSKEEVMELINEHTNKIKASYDSVTNNRVGEERPASDEIDKLSQRSTELNQSITEQSDALDRSSREVEQLINEIESSIEQQQQIELEDEEEFTF